MSFLKRFSFGSTNGNQRIFFNRFSLVPLDFKFTHCHNITFRDILAIYKEQRFKPNDYCYVQVYVFQC